MQPGVDISYLLNEYGKRPITQPMSKISEYAENKRVLPPNTPVPGIFRNEITPYGIELQDNMSPSSIIQHQSLMKGCQLGATLFAENILAYWMSENPAPILFMSATDDLLEEWSALRLEFLIDSCGFRHKLVAANSTNRKSKKTGDKAMLKEFVGGFLAMASAQSPGKQRSKSVRLLIRDEIDGCPEQLRTGEGNWLAVSAGRTDGWGARKKIYDLSTPALFLDSAIYKQYKAGDQRKFFVPCPHCGGEQFLEFGSEADNFGLKPVKEGGELITVYYKCKFCDDPIYNHHKTKMMNKGYWKPTAKSVNPVWRSYHLPSLYSPVRMLSWMDMWRKYEEALRTDDGMRSFTNLYLGLPYREVHNRPKFEKVIKLRGEYRAGTIPYGVVYLTVGIDVQRGSKTDRKNPPRLELEVMGIGLGYSTWSIIYKRIEGAIGDPYAGAWAKLQDWVMEGGLNFSRSDGVEFQAKIILIDSGDGKLTSVVYSFTQGWLNTYPSKGFQKITKKKGEKKDELSNSNFKRYRSLKIDDDTKLVEMSTNYYKARLYGHLKIEYRNGEKQKPGYCSFPIDYDKTFFKMLTAEEQNIDDGSFTCPSGRRNEALDTRVMCLCGADVYLDTKLSEFKAAALDAGANDIQMKQINHRYVIETMQNQLS